MLGVDHAGGQVLVLTAQATIGDVIKDGTVHLEAPIKFGAMHARREPRPRSWTELSSRARMRMARRVLRATRWEISSKAPARTRSRAGRSRTGAATPAGDRLNIDLDMTKEADGDLAFIVGAHGHITNFNVVDDLKASASQRL